jgi:hypothetical protein
MPDFKAPGVYIEEIAAPGPISGVGTSTAAFVGPAETGEPGVPTKVTDGESYRMRTRGGGPRS